MRNHDGGKLVAVFARKVGQHRDRLLAIRRVVVDERDLLAAQLVEAACLVADVAHRRRGLVPVGGDERKHIREDRPVGGIRAAVADRHDRDAVGGALLDERIGDAGRQRVHQGRARGSVVLGALVAFDAARVVVLGLALLPGELDAVDPAVARVDHLKVVEHAARDARAARRVGSNPVEVGGHELLLLRMGLGPAQGEGRGGERQDTVSKHSILH